MTKTKPKTSQLIEHDLLLWQKVVADVKPLVSTKKIKFNANQDEVMSAAASVLSVNVKTLAPPLIKSRLYLEQFEKNRNRFSDKNYCGKSKKLEQSVAPCETKTALNVPTSKERLPKTDTRPILSRKAQRKVARQHFDRDMCLDLHDLNQDKAYRLLLHFIHSKASRNQSLLLVITGKGRSVGSQGILRQLVPQWLSSPPFCTYVSTVENAARHHGGEGAFYVRLRKRSS